MNEQEMYDSGWSKVAASVMAVFILGPILFFGGRAVLDQVPETLLAFFSGAFPPLLVISLAK